MKKALIGNTGFVGSNINSQIIFDDFYNSKTIEEIDGKSYDLLICAGAPGVKWLANKEPENDKKSIDKLTKSLERVSVKKFVLISTVDVYPQPTNIYEDSIIEKSLLSPYGLHRRLLEEFVIQKFSKHTIIRLPALFGDGLKKNFIFDLMTNTNLGLTDSDSLFQFYSLSHLAQDINIAMEANLPVLNIATEPISASELAKISFAIDFKNKTERTPVAYNMKSHFEKFFNGENGYLYQKEQVLKDIQSFLKLQVKS